ncbi:hypothetical protein B296_00022142 [Ensete ventricosum]|uniref:Uncharacterized protein n=1 Tax=Ensete ventricosum TaxID=4639 RepID=A0A427ARB5_ENSVE|nr:hypothetical protein B296_00022142 [Ensete ventricosum]
MDLTGMGIVSAVGTEMGEAVGVMEVIVIIVNALVHMNALVEAVVAIDLNPVAASVPEIYVRGYPKLLEEKMHIFFGTDVFQSNVHIGCSIRFRIFRV